MLKLTLVEPLPAVSEVLPNVKPPIVPELDVIVPVTLADWAVIAPAEVTTN